jgi:hypothetical protein
VGDEEYKIVVFGLYLNKASLYFFISARIKYSMLNDRKIILITPANGGAPSGHICPSRTMAFKTISIINMIVRTLFIVILFAFSVIVPM